MAVSEDEEPDDQAQERIHDQAGVSLAPSPTQPGAPRLQALHNQERRLVNQGSHAVDWVKATTAGTFWAACVTGLGVFSGLFFSQQIVSSASDYGSIGVVMILLSYLIGLGVCIHLGAVAGRMWDERRSEPPAEPEELPAAADTQAYLRRTYRSGWAIVSITAAVARTRTSFSPGATSTP